MPRASTLEVPSRLRDDSLEVMNFLNEIVDQYPDAISFAPGRPREELFSMDEALRAQDDFVREVARKGGRSEEQVRHRLGQYGPTNGIIRDLLARHLRVDEGIDVPPEAIMVTVGCQEAMAIVLCGLFERDRDVLLVSDPTYIGITGLARILGIEVEAVEMGPSGLQAAAVAEAAERVRRRGRRPRAVYDIPDFNNPLGTCVPPEERRRLLDLAEAEDLYLVEDNPYGMFAYDGPPEQTLKALDRTGRVLYLGSFAKTIFPGLRVGFLVADQAVSGDGRRTLAEVLSCVKSLTTVNTSGLAQAVVGGVLLREAGSLRRWVEPRVAFYRRSRDLLLAALERAEPRVEVNRPRGGFFVVVTLARPFGADELRVLAQDYGVIVSPMSFFSLGPGRERQVRLSFSYAAPDQIEEGVARLARYLRDRGAAG